MVFKKYKLGDLITQRREKNDSSDLIIRGVCKDGLIPPKQLEADISIYNVFYRNDFIFNPARMELNSIAFNDQYDKAICSSLYEVFFVHRLDILLPEYLNLIVKQEWFTRYCDFLGQGSAREYCRFANISEIEINLPSLEDQHHIVEVSNSFLKSIELKRIINEKLEQYAMNLFELTFRNEHNSSKITLKDTISIVSKSIAPDKMSDNHIWHYSIPAFDLEKLPVFDRTVDILSNKNIVTEDSILISKMNPDNKRIWRTLSCFENSVCSTEFIVVNCMNNKHRNYYYLLFNTNKFTEFMISNSTGSTNSRKRVKPTSILDFEFSEPEKDKLDKFCGQIDSLFASIDNNLLEIRSLNNTRDSIIKKLITV